MPQTLALQLLAETCSATVPLRFSANPKEQARRGRGPETTGADGDGENTAAEVRPHAALSAEETRQFNAAFCARAKGLASKLRTDAAQEQSIAPTETNPTENNNPTNNAHLPGFAQLPWKTPPRAPEVW